MDERKKRENTEKNQIGKKKEKKGNIRSGGGDGQDEALGKWKSMRNGAPSVGQGGGEEWTGRAVPVDKANHNE